MLLSLFSLLFALSEDSKPLTTISFGSCNRQMLPQPIWNPIMAQNPELWIWLGDNVYADSTMEDILQAAYSLAKDNPGYKKLREKTSVIGIWDDHDYGLNDGGKHHPNRPGAQKALLDFLDVPKDSPRRQRKGIYNLHTYGPEGKRIRVILLDTRYFRDDPGPEGDVLGEAQWQWLEKELAHGKSELTVIASSIQIIPMEHRFEKWSNFPKARQRLFDLLITYKVPGVILLSGDRHIAEISRLDLPGLGYPLYEVTSSGMTHAYTGFTDETNQYRIGELYQDLNFGILKVDWDTQNLRLEVRDEQGDVIRQVAGGVRISSLRSP